MGTDTESSSDWLVRPKKLVSVILHNKHRFKTKHKLSTKLVANKNTENKLYEIISKALKENSISRALKETRFVNLNSNDKLELNDGTPVTISSVYHPKKTKKTLAENILVLIDCGSSHSMAKASIVKQYKNTFFKREIIL